VGVVMGLVFAAGQQLAAVQGALPLDDNGYAGQSQQIKRFCLHSSELSSGAAALAARSGEYLFVRDDAWRWSGVWGNSAILWASCCRMGCCGSVGVVTRVKGLSGPGFLFTLGVRVRGRSDKVLWALEALAPR
jgi:hypothetical protein